MTSVVMNASTISEKVKENMRLVHYVYSRLPEQSRKLYPKDDLIAIGTIGLVKAIYSFDSNKGKFSTYAVYAIKHQILQEFRKDSAKRKIPKAVQISLDTTVASDNSNHNLLLSEVIPDADYLGYYELLWDIQKFMNNLSVRHKIVFTGIMNRETQRDIADKLGIAQAQVSRISKRLKLKFKEFYYGKII